MEKLLCYCQHHCPFASSYGICEAEAKGKCFSSVETNFDKNGNEFKYFTYGCLTLNNTIQFMNPSSASFKGTKYVRRCTGFNYCNKPSIFSLENFQNVDIFIKIVITCLILSIIISLLIIVILIALNCRKYKKNREINANYLDNEEFNRKSAKIWITNMLLNFSLLAINVYKTLKENIAKFMLRIKIQRPAKKAHSVDYHLV